MLRTALCDMRARSSKETHFSIHGWGKSTEGRSLRTSMHTSVKANGTTCTECPFQAWVWTQKK